MNDEPVKLVITRTFPAPIAQVYEAWTDASTMRQWLCPGDMSVAEAETDVREGGRYRVAMREPNGEIRRTGGTYREVVPNRKLVFSWQWEGSEHETQVTVELAALAEAETELTLTHEGFADISARDSHNGGWMGCLNKLESVCTRATGTPTIVD